MWLRGVADLRLFFLADDKMGGKIIQGLTQVIVMLILATSYQLHVNCKLFSFRRM